MEERPRAYRILDPEEVDAASPAALLESALGHLVQLNRRLQVPDAYHRFSRWRRPVFPQDRDPFWALQPEESAWREPEDPKDSLPQINMALEQLRRLGEVAATLLAGFAEEAMQWDLDQQEVLGIPATARGYSKTAGYLVDTLKISYHEANKRLERARMLGGEDPELPGLAESFRDGRVPIANSDRLIGLMKNARTYGVRSGAESDRVEQVVAASETILTEIAETMEPGEFSRACRSSLQRIASSISQDGPPPEQLLNSRREKWSMREISGGAELSLRVFGINAEFLVTLDRQLRKHYRSLGAALTAGDEPVGEQLRLPEPEAEPEQEAVQGPGLRPEDLVDAQRIQDREFPAVGPGTELVQDQSGEIVQYSPVTGVRVDDRAEDQKVLDAFMALLLAALRMSSTEHGIPKSRGYDTKVLTIMDLTTMLQAYQHHQLSLEAAEQPSLTRHESRGQNLGELPPGQLRHLMCEAQIIPVVLDGSSQVVDFGRGRRTFTQKQFEALLVRDGGCTVPGCTISGNWTQAHHIEHWSQGGVTDIANATLLCPAHHRDVHEGKWTILGIDEEGSVWYRPAPWLDPDQTPKRNNYWRQRRKMDGEAS